MALKSYTQLAEEYQQAIEAITIGGAQSYNIGSRAVTKADLATLERLYMKYRTLAKREQKGGFKSQRAIPHDV